MGTAALEGWSGQVFQVGFPDTESLSWKSVCKHVLGSDLRNTCHGRERTGGRERWMDGDITATGDSASPWGTQNLGWSVTDAPDGGKGNRLLWHPSTSHWMSAALEWKEGVHANLGKVETSQLGNHPPPPGRTQMWEPSSSQLEPLASTSQHPPQEGASSSDLEESRGDQHKGSTAGSCLAQSRSTKETSVAGGT